MAKKLFGLMPVILIAFAFAACGDNAIVTPGNAGQSTSQNTSNSQDASGNQSTNNSQDANDSQSASASASSLAILSGAVAITGSAGGSGFLEAGVILTADISGVTGADGAPVYQWYTGATSAAITGKVGANVATHTAAAAGFYKVEATWDNGSLASPVVTVINPAGVSGEVVIAGNPAIGATLTANISGVLNAKGAPAYQWYENGGGVYIPVDLATDSTFMPVMRGQYTVEVTWGNGSLTSDPIEMGWNYSNSVMTFSLNSGASKTIGGTDTCQAAEYGVSGNWGMSLQALNISSSFFLSITDIGAFYADPPGDFEGIMFDIESSYAGGSVDWTVGGPYASAGDAILRTGGKWYALSVKVTLSEFGIAGSYVQGTFSGNALEIKITWDPAANGGDGDVAITPVSGIPAAISGNINLLFIGREG